MKDYPNYEIIQIDEDALKYGIKDVEKYADQFCILIDEKPLYSPKNNLIAHTEYRFIKSILFESCEFITDIDPQNLSFYSLYSIVIDMEEEINDLIIKNIDKVIYRDTCFLNVAGPEQVEQYQRKTFLLDYFSTNGLNYISPPDYYMNKIAEGEGKGSEFEDIRTLFIPIINHFKLKYNELNIYQKAILFRTYAAHRSTIIAYMLMENLCITDEYADLIMANEALLGNVFIDVSPNDHKEIRRGLIQDADRLKSFSIIGADSFKDSISTKLANLLNKGECKNVEFKSTYRKNLKSNLHDKEMTFEIFKAIGAFLNSGGGNLIVGVDDSGTVLGLENDDFKNNDELLKNFYDTLQHCFSLNIAEEYVSTEIIPYSGKNVLFITVKNSKKEIFTKNKLSKKYKKDIEILFIRTGPQTKRLRGIELAEWIKKKN